MKKPQNFIIALSLLLLASCNNQVIEPEKANVEKSVVFNEVIVFSSDRNSLSKNLFLMNINGDSVQQLTFYEYEDYIPTAISQDGKYILFYKAWSSDINIGTEIYILNIIDDIIIGPLAYGTSGNFLPNGVEFIYTKHIFTPNGGFDSVWLFNVKDSTEHQITKDFEHTFQAMVSKDGSTLCYAERDFSVEYTYTRIHLMDIYGNKLEALSPLSPMEVAINPIFIPNSNKIAFIYMSREKLYSYDLCLVDINSKLVTALTSYKERSILDVSCPNLFNPYPNRDGDIIYMNTNVGNTASLHKPEIACINIDGTEVKNLTNNEFWDSNPVVGFLFYFK